GVRGLVCPLGSARVRGAVGRFARGGAGRDARAAARWTEGFETERIMAVLAAKWVGRWRGPDGRTRQAARQAGRMYTRVYYIHECSARTRAGRDARSRSRALGKGGRLVAPEQVSKPRTVTLRRWRGRAPADGTIQRCGSGGRNVPNDYGVVGPYVDQSSI